MKKIGVVVNCTKSQVGAVLDQISRKAGELDLELYAFNPTAELLPGAKVIKQEDLDSTIDALMVLGGDGSMLRRAVSRRAKGIGTDLGEVRARRPIAWRGERSGGLRKASPTRHPGTGLPYANRSGRPEEHAFVPSVTHPSLSLATNTPQRCDES